MSVAVPSRTVIGLACAAGLLPAAPAAALTADALWQAWQDQATESEQEITAAETSRDGDALTLSGVRSRVTYPDGSATVMLDRIVLTEQDDGSVTVDPSPVTRLTTEAAPEDGESSTTEIEIATTDLSLVARGQPPEIDYQVEAGGVDITLTSLTVDGEPVEVEAGATMTGLSGDYLVESGDGTGNPATTGQMSVDAVALAATGADDEGTGFSLEATYEDVAVESFGTGGLFGNADALVSRDVTAGGAYSYGATSSRFSVEGPEGGTLATQSEGGRSEYDLSDGNLTVDGAMRNMTFTAESPQLPGPPVEASIDEIATRFTFPLAPSDEQRDIALMLNLDGLTVDDQLWAMVDPQGILPRTPARLKLDLAGRMTLNEALSEIDPEDESAATFDSLTIRELELGFAGAELSGDGDLTFQAPSDDAAEPPEGTDDMIPAAPPMPEGQINLTLSGANALMDDLVTLGVLPEDQVMGARMMLGLFAESVGDDLLRSRIRLGPDGQVTANGQRIR
ncbi:hypothetical protein SAMN04490244_10953 [Tranquillimonas rosea]|uniref:DUF2125 domain-containing protein n=1 Tax=Tranquillimonas rosea TaxID=641238 RepID=A0A1H9W3R1_9RHOB|nr:hypothetical protein [Tranquillimonas rosea]SES28327.1 hypothetical protein SAMN04490244_10953 [Tranquillimonas rosea]